MVVRGVVLTKLQLVLLMAVAVVVGCASTRKQAGPTAKPGPDAAAANDHERVRLTLDPSLAGDAMTKELGRQARAVGIAAPVALVWGKPASIPESARRTEIDAGGVVLQGWLVGRAHQIDMGKLAPSIHDVVLVDCGREHLYASYPPAAEKKPVDFERPDADARIQERFAFVSLEPGDVSDDARAAQVVGLLSRLPEHARYAVLGLGE